MFEFIQQGGFMMYPLLVVAVAVVVLAVRGALRVRENPGPDAVLETGIDAVLFWGAWGAVLGVLGTVVGMYIAAGAISAAGEVSPTLVWGGIRVALSTTLFGLVVFALAAVAWFVLRVRYRRQAAAA